MKRMVLILSAGLLTSVAVLSPPAAATLTLACVSTANWTFNPPLSLSGGTYTGSITSFDNCGLAGTLSDCSPNIVCGDVIFPVNNVGFTLFGNCLLATGSTSNGWNLRVIGGTIVEMDFVSGLSHGVIAGVLAGIPCDMPAAIFAGAGYVTLV